MNPFRSREPRSPSRLRREIQGPTNYHNEDYAAGSYSGMGPKSYRRSDERLREIICDVLTEAPDVDPTDVEVSVKGGIARLEGSVPSRRMKRITEYTVEHVAGVLDVQNHLDIR